MSNPPKTLVILTPAFPGNESETHWVPTQQLFVKALKEQYPDLHIIVLSLYYPYPSSVYKWHGVPVISFNGTRQRKIRRVFFWNDIWQQLKKIRREQEVIGLFSFWCGECALIGHYFGRYHGLRHLCWICGQDARATNGMVRLIHPRGEELIAMSDFLAEEFAANHGVRPRYTIPNGIDPGRFPSLSSVRDSRSGVSADTPPPSAMDAGAALAAKQRDIDILGVGSLSRLKRYDLLVEIVRSLRPTFPGIRAMLCGDGEEKEALQAQIAANGLENNFCLTGERPHEEVLGLMQRTRVFLHTSGYEGFGVVCLEALYAGAHVISFCRPMQRDIPHWHIVRDMPDMALKAAALLLNSSTEYTPVLPYRMEESVREVMQLFGV